MARYLLDTDVLVDFSRLVEPALSRISAMIRDGDEIGVYAVQLAEYYAGERRGKHPEMDALFSRIPCWALSPETAIRAGEYRYAFARRGRTIGTPDAINAAVAWEMRATIVTRNVKDYSTPGVPVLAF